MSMISSRVSRLLVRVMCRVADTTHLLEAQSQLTTDFISGIAERHSLEDSIRKSSNYAKAG
jgi:hypothetical protein